MRTILITGGAGFIGGNVNYLIKRYPEDRIVVLDMLTYAGSIESLPKEMLHGRHPLLRFWYGNVCNAALVDTLVEEADVVIHMAAETHVTRSIFDSLLFFQTDVLATQTIANAVVKAGAKVKRFIHVSSSEVYGTARPTAICGRASCSCARFRSSPRRARPSITDVAQQAIMLDRQLFVRQFPITTPFGQYLVPLNGQAFLQR
jgi:dTDP-D-glucose 4,6-dehydratase